jgi:hypothetical protein
MGPLINPLPRPSFSNGAYPAIKRQILRSTSAQFRHDLPGEAFGILEVEEDQNEARQAPLVLRSFLSS